MVDWQDPAVVSFCAFLYSQNAVLLLGIFGHHFITSMSIEWSLIRRKRPFSPALVPYLFGRYAILSTLFFFVLSDRLKNKMSCDVAYKILAVLGSSASSCSTLNLGIRSYIIWRDMNKIVIWILSLACVGHAALVALQGAWSVSSQWIPELASCAVIRSSNITMFVFYLYTTVVDMVILGLTIYGLSRKAALRSTIGATLSEQCLWYCAATFIVNIPAAVFPMLNLNVLMNVMFSMPATTVSVIMSSAAVLSLKPEEPADSDTRDARDRNRCDMIGIAVHSRSRRVTLTTNIVLEPEINSSDVSHSFDIPASRKSGDEVAAAV
ncbi:hypothetical protein BV20DRAFT_1043087 [Pilatotrama ljubarskyi]|nr:hypothetical protein BV20DRAFT_1043087 [Pilatotrama ljubarskyi]